MVVKRKVRTSAEKAKLFIEKFGEPIIEQAGATIINQRVSLQTIGLEFDEISRSVRLTYLFHFSGSASVQRLKLYSTEIFYNPEAEEVDGEIDAMVEGSELNREQVEAFFKEIE